MSTSPGVRDTDVKLIKLAARGNTEAFSRLFEGYFDSVYNFALWLCNDPHMAEDLVQETFIRAHKNLHRLGPPYNVRSWLYRMARNLFVDMRRRQPETHPLEPSLEPGDENDPETEMLSSELSGPVRRALQRLSPNHREALILREVEHMQYEDIAAVMGVSLDNVKVLLHRARNSFRDEYGIRLMMEEPLPDCTMLNELLDAMADGVSVGKQEAMVRDHIKDCPTCQQRKRAIAALAILLQGQHRFTARPGVKERIAQEVERPRPARNPDRWRRLAAMGAASAMLIFLIWMWRFLGLPDPTGGDGRGGGSGDVETATPTRPSVADPEATEGQRPTDDPTPIIELLVITPDDVTPTSDTGVIPFVPPTDEPTEVITETPTNEPTLAVCSPGWYPVASCVCCGANRVCPDHIEENHAECIAQGGNNTGGTTGGQQQGFCGDNICQPEEKGCGVCSIDCGPC